MYKSFLKNKKVTNRNLSEMFEMTLIVDEYKVSTKSHHSFFFIYFQQYTEYMYFVYNTGHS